MDSLYWKILYLHIETIPKEKVLNSELSKKKPSKTLTSSPGFHTRFLIDISTSCLEAGGVGGCSTDPAWLGISTLVNSRQILKIRTSRSENCCIGHGNAQATFSARALR